MSLVEVQYHPLLFSTMALLAMTELGLTAYLINAGNEHNSFPSEKYQALLITYCFAASWTTLFSATYIIWFFDKSGHLLANIASSVAWLLASAILWGATSGLMHFARPGGNCARQPTLSICRQMLAVEALGWTECGVIFLTAFATCFWMYASRRMTKQVAGESATRLV
ncbi:hypothetical protein FA15DRAFT_9720 [Coprinopsis marcescibilis]|uniref:MARVEL domain-containing protein n=1 Tax=Coprinopsis marcescibilis TaxID=230819 RepID=A0A5C3LC92_COPMA|nr:hypothetical protein FA15DRAFT_9720 [Coprinopsis marcescibilis]